MSNQGLKRTRILLFQTEVSDCISDATDKLRGEDCFPNAEILLVCSEVDREIFEATREFKEIEVFSKHDDLRRLRELKQAIDHFDPDLGCAVFSGRPIFRKARLVFLALSPRRRFVFDARLEGYWLTLRSFRRIFLHDPKAMSRYSAESSTPLRTLLIETESREAVEQAIKTIGKPEVVPNAQISLFCGVERVEKFRGNSALHEFHCYTKKSLLRDLKVLWPFFRSKPDVLVAIFSGRRVFMKQKMLYWLLPARARLAFNEHNDCFYLTRWNAFRLLRFDSRGSSLNELASRRVIQLILKGFLFLPRFAYLLVWVTLMKLLRAYRLEQIAKYTSRT